jgi:hypothetical protein
LVSEDPTSPLLEAHPGSPMDISGRRPSLVQALATQQRLYSSSGLNVPRSERFPHSAIGIRKEEIFNRDGVAVKNHNRGFGIRSIEGTGAFSKNLTVFIPPPTIPLGDKTPTTTTISTAMDLDFDDAESWVSNPAMESHSSLATTTTATSNLHNYSHDLAPLDTSVISSAASMDSFDVSIHSAITANSSDIYGWETELDRKTSTTESQFSTKTWEREREREMMRRLPSGGRTHLGPKISRSMTVGSAANGLSMRNTGCTGGNGRVEGVQRRVDPRHEGKRKSLLYRVLNINGKGRDVIPEVPTIPTINGGYDIPMV